MVAGQRSGELHTQLRMRNLNLDLERCFPESYWDTQQDLRAGAFISSEKEATDELARVLLSAGADPADVASALNHYFRRMVEVVLVPGCDLKELAGHHLDHPSEIVVQGTGHI